MARGEPDVPRRWLFSFARVSDPDPKYSGAAHFPSLTFESFSELSGLAAQYEFGS